MLVETDAGLNARARNGAYEDMGATLKDRKTVIQASDVLVMINGPADADLDIRLGDAVEIAS
ncbi:MAG TPA: hypothetical protein P5248_02815, partial [Bacteroidales bacterium]|nr:hypothetical protein [Bacteroidales bacterium]